MLVKLFRIGPSRQQLRKGWVIVAKDPGLLSRSLKSLRLPGQLTLVMPTGALELATPFWIDTGMRWLHSFEAREACFEALREATALLAACLEDQGAHLYPAAVAPDESFQWSRLCCGDEHVLEVYDDIEREVVHNRIRQESDLLIALTGRCRISPAGVMSGGSVRLERSGFCASPYLESCEAGYLERMLTHLKRHRGISTLESLDLHLGREQGSSLPQLHIQLNDAQTLLSSSRVQLILYQALLLQGRRLARGGDRVNGTRQTHLEQSRTQSIARGIRAPLTDQNGEKRKGFERLEALLHELVGELRILGVTPDELAPLASGAGLTCLGFEAALSENELFCRSFRKASPRIPLEMSRIASSQQLSQKPAPTEVQAEPSAQPILSPSGPFLVLLPGGPAGASESASFGGSPQVPSHVPISLLHGGPHQPNETPPIAPASPIAQPPLSSGWASLADYNREQNPTTYPLVMMQWEALLLSPKPPQTVSNAPPTPTNDSSRNDSSTAEARPGASLHA